MRISLYDGGLVRRLKRAADERVRREARRSSRGRWWKSGGGGRAAFWWIWLLVNAARLVAQPENAAQWKAYVLGSTSLALAGVSLSLARKLGEKLTTGKHRVLPGFGRSCPPASPLECALTKKRGGGRAPRFLPTPHRHTNRSPRERTHKPQAKAEGPRQARRRQEGDKKEKEEAANEQLNTIRQTLLRGHRAR